MIDLHECPEWLRVGQICPHCHEEKRRSHLLATFLTADVPRGEPFIVPPIPHDARLVRGLLNAAPTREQTFGWGVAVGVVLCAVWVVMFALWKL